MTSLAIRGTSARGNLMCRRPRSVQAANRRVVNEGALSRLLTLDNARFQTFGLVAQGNCLARANTAIGGAGAWLAGGRSPKPWGRVRT